MNRKSMALLFFFSSIAGAPRALAEGPAPDGDPASAEAAAVMETAVAVVPPEDTGSLAAALEAKLAAARSERARAPAMPRAAVVPPAQEAPRALGPGLEFVGFGALVALGLFGAAWAVRKHRSRQPLPERARALEVVESTWLGKGQKLVLVSVDGQRVLLGVTGGGIESLTTFGPVSVPAPKLETGMRSNLREGDDEGPRFADMVKQELMETFKPSRDDRRRILQQLGRL